MKKLGLGFFTILLVIVGFNYKVQLQNAERAVQAENTVETVPVEVEGVKIRDTSVIKKVQVATKNIAEVPKAQADEPGELETQEQVGKKLIEQEKKETQKTETAQPKNIVVTEDIKSRLVASSIGVNAPVVAMGTDPDGRMSVPHNYTSIGWYKYGSYPGNPGTAVFGAHVDNGSTIDGVFKNLDQLKAGDQFYFYDKDGKKLMYIVEKTKRYHYQDTNVAEVFNSTGSASRLNLITCAGNWMSSENTYDSRLVVFAMLQ